MPEWPASISREDARFQKDRATRFQAALKSRAKAHGWSYAGGNLFRRQDEWFVDVLPSLLWERGMRVTRRAKPMAVDPIFWSVVGLPENERMPLSFRANGAWVLRSPPTEGYLALSEAEPELLAEEVLEWCTRSLPGVSRRTVRDLLADLRTAGDLRDHFSAMEVCLRILLHDFDGASALCSNRAADDHGGFTTGDATFFDQARAWIASARRDRIAPV